MSIKLANVVPFGRSLAEYQLMFALSPTDLEQRILGIADGPASFNAEATPLGATITSVDPIYRFSGPEIEARFNAVVDDIIAQVEATPANLVRSYHDSPQHLRRNREQALHQFLADYDIGRQAGRYQIGELPHLSFPDQRFDLTLCSHFLFLYSEHFDQKFHIDAIDELLRISQEVRIFPLLTLNRQPSPYLAPLMQIFRNQGKHVERITVNYELQRGGNQMLVLRNQ